MIYLTAVIKAKPEYREDVTVVLQNMVTETRKEDANISMICIKVRRTKIHLFSTKFGEINKV